MRNFLSRIPVPKKLADGGTESSILRRELTLHELRDLFPLLVARLVFILLPLSSLTAYAAASVSQENMNQGTADWRITTPRCNSCPYNAPYNDPSAQSLYGSVEIQGYASKASVNQGEEIKFFISTGVPTSYTMNIYRIGWYGGLGGRLMQGPIPLNGTPQTVPAPDSTGLIECNWPVSYSFIIPSSWVSGIYLAKLQTAAGVQSYIIFIVRDDSRPSPFLYKTSDATYQAYNEWGGSSLYTTLGPNFSGPKSGYRVSYSRPYWRAHGSGDFLAYEINMVRWLEKQGYDVTYVTDVDTHQNPDLLLTHRAFLVVGHSEYWSWRMRANVEKARERGVSLGFFAANSVYWQIRFEPSTIGDLNRTVAGYKEDALSQDPYATDSDPSNDRFTTTWWSNAQSWKTPYLDPVNRPEESLLGVEYTPPPSDSGIYSGDIAVTDPSSWPGWLAQSTGLSDGSLLPDMLGYETDEMHFYHPTGTIKIAHSLFPKGAPPGQQIPADATLYNAPSGANVLASGSINWDLGLDDFGRSQGIVPAAQQMTANFLNQALQVPASPALARLAAAPSASSSDAAYPASNANDGSNSTQWVASLAASPNNNNAWFQLDFGTRKWINRLKWLGAINTPYPADSPANYSIQISNDAVNWQTLFTRTNGARVANGNELINQQARYIRLVTTQVNDGTGWSLSFFELWAEGAAPPPSGRLRTLRVSGSAEANGTNYSVGKASDLDFTTQWVASLEPSLDNNNAWYQIDLGSRKQIDRVRWAGANGSPYPASSPTNYSIQVSDDGVSWNTVLVRTNTGRVVNGNESMSAQGRYVRIMTTKVNDGTGWSLSFYELWAEGDASNILAANATASAEATGYPAANAVDGSTATQWVANFNPTFNNNNASFQLDFGSRKQINRIRWQGADGSPYPASSPTDYSIQVSDDGANWRAVATRTHTIRVTNGDELINAQGRFLRLVTTKVNDGTGWSLSFFEFWAEGY